MKPSSILDDYISSFERYV